MINDLRQTNAEVFCILVLPSRSSVTGESPHEGPHARGFSLQMWIFRRLRPLPRSETSRPPPPSVAAASLGVQGPRPRPARPRVCSFRGTPCPPSIPDMFGCSLLPTKALGCSASICPTPFEGLKKHEIDFLVRDFCPPPSKASVDSVRNQETQVR